MSEEMFDRQRVREGLIHLTRHPSFENSFNLVDLLRAISADEDGIGLREQLHLAELARKCQGLLRGFDYRDGFHRPTPEEEAGGYAFAELREYSGHRQVADLFMKAKGLSWKEILEDRDMAIVAIILEPLLIMGAREECGCLVVPYALWKRADQLCL